MAAGWGAAVTVTMLMIFSARGMDAHDAVGSSCRRGLLGGSGELSAGGCGELSFVTVMVMS
jgi:hypothetical protein